MMGMADRRTSFADDVMGTVTAFGSPAFTFIVIGVAAAGALLWLRSPRLVRLPASLYGSPPPSTTVLKQLVERPRPNFSRALDVSGFAFPSGHATSAATVAAALLVLVVAAGSRRARRLCVDRSDRLRPPRRPQQGLPGRPLAERCSGRLRPRGRVGGDLCLRVLDPPSEGAGRVARAPAVGNHRFPAPVLSWSYALPGSRRHDARPPRGQGGHAALPRGGVRQPFVRARRRSPGEGRRGGRSRARRGRHRSESGRSSSSRPEGPRPTTWPSRGPSASCAATATTSSRRRSSTMPFSIPWSGWRVRAYVTRS